MQAGRTYSCRFRRLRNQCTFRKGDHAFFIVLFSPDKKRIRRQPIPLRREVHVSQLSIWPLRRARDGVCWTEEEQNEEGKGRGGDGASGLNMVLIRFDFWCWILFCMTNGEIRLELLINHGISSKRWHFTLIFQDMLPSISNIFPSTPPSRSEPILEKMKGAYK